MDYEIGRCMLKFKQDEVRFDHVDFYYLTVSYPLKGFQKELLMLIYTMRNLGWLNVWKSLVAFETMEINIDKEESVELDGMRAKLHNLNEH